MKGKIARLLEVSRVKVKPTVPRLIFDCRVGQGEERKRNFDEYMKEKEGELRAAWLREEVESKGPGRWVEGFGLGLALRPPATPTRETSLAASRHAPATMPQPEFEEPFEEPAEGVFKPTEGSIGGYGQ